MESVQIVLTAGSAVAALASVILVLRLQREAVMSRNRDLTWIAGADWLIIVAGAVAFLGVLAPLLFIGPSPGVLLLARGGLLGATILCCVFWPAVWAHYGVILEHRCADRPQAWEEAERVIVWSGFALAAVVVSIFLVTNCC